jgi:hypothetical protein
MGVVGRSRRWTDAGGWEIRESWYVPRREACDASIPGPRFSEGMGTRTAGRGP